MRGQHRPNSFQPSSVREGATPMMSRRAMLGAGALVTGGLLLPATAAARPGASTDQPLTAWIDRTATALESRLPDSPARDLQPIDRLVSGARLVGLGESAHGTHDQFVLKHRIARYLVQHHGFDTLAWEEAWASGVAIDRYVTGGPGDPEQIVAQAGFNLQNRDMLDLMSWLRGHNQRQPRHRQVRFLGADVTQLRELQFAELEQHVRAVAPGRLRELGSHLDPLRIRQNPGWHTYWYLQLDQAEQRELVEHARAVRDLVSRLPDAPSAVDAGDAALHALTLLGFYESYTQDGIRNDVRDRYIVKILGRWGRQRRRMIYSAANAHTVAAARQLISFPPDAPVVRSLAGGMLRERYGRGYVNIAITFDHGTIYAGWHNGQPARHDVPPPHSSFVDHTLGSARLPDYILDLSARSPRPVDRWLDGSGTLRVIGGSAYDPATDQDNFMSMHRWGRAVDGVVHLASVSASRLL